jgi:phage-related protein
MIHSTTIVLPLWFQTLKKLKLDERKMPHDVTTRWNSTFDMLVFTLQYRKAIDDITGNKTTSLCKYELSEEEWRIAEQLCDMLKVCVGLAD